MNNEAMQICEYILKAAKNAGADDCKVIFSKRRFVEMSHRDHKLEEVKEATSQNIGMDVFVNQRFSTQTTVDLRQESLDMFVRNAIETTKLLEEDPYRCLPDPRYYEGRQDIELEMSDNGYETVTPELRLTMTRELEDSCREAGGDKVVSITSGVYDEFSDVVILTSNGFQGHEQKTMFHSGVGMTAQDEGDRRPAGWDFAGSRSIKGLPAARDIGKQAAARTLELLGAKKIATETLPVIIDNRCVGNVLGNYVWAMNGAALQQKSSFLEHKKGEKTGSGVFTLIDDPFIVGGMGSRLFDGEGFAAQKRVMVDQGVLKEYFIDWYRSRKLGVEPTAGGPANLILPPGERSVAEIMKDLGRGILINGFIGGNSNPNTGDFSIGITGTLFENGEPAQAVAEMNIAGNHLQFWHKLTEAANDPWPYSSWRLPSLVFSDVVVSGM